MKFQGRTAIVPTDRLWYDWHWAWDMPDDFMRVWESQRLEVRAIQIEMADAEI